MARPSCLIKIRKLAFQMFLTFFSFYGLIYANSLEEDIDKYFLDLQEDFNTIGSSSILKKTSLSATDRYFVSALKKNQVFYSLIRTNSKGTVISEIIRGEKPQREFRDISDQAWFSDMASQYKDYQGFIKNDETGRYYLLWCKPVLKTTRNGSKQFIGAVMAKIDLWDCFYKFSTNREKPFLIRIFDRKDLFSHKWKNEEGYRESALSVPGIDKISVRYISGDAVTEPNYDSLAAVAQKEADELSSKMKKPGLQNLKNNKIVLSVIIVCLLVAIIIVWILYSRFKNWQLMRKIEKEDRLI